MVNTHSSDYLNLEAVQVNGNIFYRTKREIELGEELFCSYGEKYDADLKITPQKKKKSEKKKPNKETQNKKTKLRKKTSKGNYFNFESSFNFL